METTASEAVCNLCQSKTYTFLYEKALKNYSQKNVGQNSSQVAASDSQKPKQLLSCSKCGLVYTHPKSSSDELTREYKTMVDVKYIAEQNGLRVQAQAIMQKIQVYKQNGKLLDIGCGSRILLDEAKRTGWDAQGIDISTSAKPYTQNNDQINLASGSLQDIHFPDKSFDAITMLDILEHQPNPKEFLQEVYRVLKHDGVLYINTPDINSLLSKALGLKWHGINKSNLFYFSKQSLTHMFKLTGFKVKQFSAYPRSFTHAYWVKRLAIYPRFILALFNIYTKVCKPKNGLFSIYLHDRLDVIAMKIKTIDTIELKDQSTIASHIKTTQKVFAVLPAYNAEQTLKKTVDDIPRDIVDEVILVDDVSKDNTVQRGKELGLKVIRHKSNTGYGGNQKTCYREALKAGADIVVMVHPDYQYDPTSIPRMVEPILKGQAEAVFGSRMMKGGALEGGMPLWKHNANILLTAFENVCLGTYLTEYHSGFRAYSAKYLNTVDFESNSNNFVFDTEIIAQGIANHLKIEEIPIHTRYFDEASSIKLWPSILYGLGIIRTMIRFAIKDKILFKNKLTSN
ncbi:MAG: 2-polyprenyl-3-methyl-5-hydroxy-6-metoxy-1,4-benzoquinol methylase [Candidatus Omnitrophota bacterium]|jgi:2-polyprenyl-3-methyl-5-hydroxy-6-metoxy-1,4-benzoquinol methylase